MKSIVPTMLTAAVWFLFGCQESKQHDSWDLAGDLSEGTDDGEAQSTSRLKGEKPRSSDSLSPESFLVDDSNSVVIIMDPDEGERHFPILSDIQQNDVLQSKPGKAHFSIQANGGARIDHAIE